MMRIPGKAHRRKNGSRAAELQVLVRSPDASSIRASLERPFGIVTKLAPAVQEFFR